nr:FGGY-family carbohydrate kinase [Nakamurella flavida]
MSLDIGSTGVRAARFADGRLGPVHERRYRTAAQATNGRPDPAVVLATVVDLLDGIDPIAVRAVSVSVQWQTLLAVDADDRPLGDVLTWESTVPAADLAEVRDALRGVFSRETSGTYLHSSSPVAAVRTVSVPGTARLTDLAGWLTRRLTGRDVGWSPVIAAASGLWDRWAGGWTSPVLSALGVDEHRLGGVCAHPVHPRLGSWAAGWAPAAAWLPALGDGLCHNLGLGAVGPGATALTVGTSGSVRALLPGSPAVPDGLWAFRVGERTTAVGGAVTSAGNVLEWVTGFTGTPVPWASFDGDRPALPDVRAVPDVYGRRGPDYPDGVFGAVSGLSPGSTPADLVRAFAVDIWRPFAVLQALLDSVTGGDPDSPVTAAGGVLRRHPAAAQLAADALGRPVHLLDEAEPALRGAALVAAASLIAPVDGVLAWVDAAARSVADEGPVRPPTVPARTVSPRPAWTRALRERWSQPG